jgi:peroxin-10
MASPQEQVTVLSLAPHILIHYSAATQTLGEEYTSIWQYSSSTQALPPSSLIRTALIILSLVPSYFIGRLGQNVALNNRHPNLAKWLKRLPPALDIVTDINLAIFYLRGNYYNLVKRVLGIHHVCVLFFLHLHILFIYF